MSQSLLHIIRTVYQCSFVKHLSGLVDIDTILLRVGTHYVELHNKATIPREETAGHKGQLQPQPQIQSLVNTDSEPTKQNLGEKTRAEFMAG